MSIALEPLKALPHQLEAIGASTKFLRNHDRARVISACGTGKTLTQMRTAEALDPTRIVVLVPTLALVKQSYEAWKRSSKWGDSLKAVFVCSDKTIGAGQNGARGPGSEDEDEDEVTLDELELVGVPTTDPLEINRNIDSQMGTVDSPVVVFSTYASADMLGAAMKMRAVGDRSFDVGIFDEAHKTAGDEGKQNAFALSDANLEIKKRAYTATPRVFIKFRVNDGDLR